MSTHEVHPPKGPFERVVEAMGIETAKLGKEGGYSIPEFSPHEFISMTAGMADPVARELAGVMSEHAACVNAAVQQMNLWGWNRMLVDWPDVKVSGRIHSKLAFAVVADYQAGGGGYELRDIRAFLGVKDQEFKRLVPHWYAMKNRLLEAESKMIHHLVRQIAHDKADAA